MDDPHADLDQAVLRRVAVGETALESPYREFDTLVAKVERLYPFLAGVARDRARTDHGTVARECGIHTTRQGRVLGALGVYEAVHGRPLLPAVVATADGEAPGDWYDALLEYAPGRTDGMPADGPARRWVWATHRADVYRFWAGDGRRNGRLAATRATA